MANRLNCMHPGCSRPAVKVIGMVDDINTLGQTHDCCSVHCQGNEGTPLHSRKKND